jgi:hypothetical protein
MIEYVQYEDKYFYNTIDYLKKEWSSIPSDKWTEYFNWKYIKNPCTNDTAIFLALEVEKIVGFRAIFIQKFVYKDNELLIGSGADAKVATNFQKKGIYTNLIKLSHEYCKENKINYQLNLTSNNNSTPILLKLGWRPLRTKRELVKLSVNSFIPRYDITNKSLHSYYNKCYSVKEYYGEQILSNDVISEIIKSGDNIGENNTIHSLRDNTYYSYKLSNPISRYLVYTFYNKDEYIGHFIVKILSSMKYFPKVNYMKIIDYKIFNNRESEIFNVFLNTVCKTSPLLKYSILTIPLLTMDHHFEQTLKYKGFIKEGMISNIITGRKSLPILIRPTELMEENWLIDDKNIQDFRNWHLTGIDADNA